MIQEVVATQVLPAALLEGNISTNVIMEVYFTPGMSRILHGLETLQLGPRAV